MVALAAVAALLVTFAAEGPVVIEDGHADLTIRKVGGGLALSVEDGRDPQNPVERDPAGVVLGVKPEAATTVPASPAFAFLGEPGRQVWLLSQTRQEGIVWPGWNTEALTGSEVSGPVSWRVTGVDGPGHFALFLTDALGAPQVLFDSRDGLPDATDVPIGTHAHGNWAFGAEGTYRIAMDLAARDVNGSELTGASTITVSVGDLPVPAEPPAVEPQAPGPGAQPAETGVAAPPPAAAPPAQAPGPGFDATAAEDEDLPETGGMPRPLVHAAAAALAVGAVLLALSATRPFRRRDCR